MDMNNIVMVPYEQWCIMVDDVEQYNFKVFDRYTAKWFGFYTRSEAINFAERCDDPVIVYEYSYQEGNFVVIGHT